MANQPSRQTQSILIGKQKPKRSNVNRHSKIDLAFLLDATGGMGQLIQGVKDNVVEIAKHLKEVFSVAELRLACVYYRDYDVELQSEVAKYYPRCGICCDFTSDVEEIRCKLENLEAWGGDDDPEDVFSGLEQLLQLKWEAPHTRVVFHIADAPCHGTRFMDSEYAKGDRAFKLKAGATIEDDPEGRKVHEIMWKLAFRAQISNYTFFHILNENQNEPNTSKMLIEFQNALPKSTTPNQMQIREKILELPNDKGHQSYERIKENLCGLLKSSIII